MLFPEDGTLPAMVRLSSGPWEATYKQLGEYA